MIAKDLIKQGFPTLRTTDKVELGLDIMADNLISHLPVVKNEKLIGILSIQDIIDLPKSTKISSITDKLTTFGVQAEDSFYALVHQLIINKSTIIPIFLNEKEFGIATMNDVFAYLGSISSVDLPGGIIVLETSMVNYSLSEIAHLAETNNATILSVFTSFKEFSQIIDIYIKFNLTDLTHVIATYERFDYVVKAHFHLSDISDIYKDRYDHLMHFLNI